MNEKVLKALATYFTGPDVAQHSMSLVVGGHRQIAAKRFFDARDALGLKGYPRADEALLIIKVRLEDK